jgi:hypothetical protein
VAGTLGQTKASGTLLAEAMIVPNKQLPKDTLAANAELAPQIDHRETKHRLLHKSESDAVA